MVSYSSVDAYFPHRFTISSQGISRCLPVAPYASREICFQYCPRHETRRGGKIWRSLNISTAYARLQQYSVGLRLFGTICLIFMYLSSLSRQATSIWLSVPYLNSLYPRPAMCLCQVPILNNHRTTSFAAFVGKSLSLSWTIPISVGLAALSYASDHSNVCLSFASSSTNRWQAFWIVVGTTLSTIRLLAMFRQGAILQIGLEDRVV